MRRLVVVVAAVALALPATAQSTRPPLGVGLSASSMGLGVDGAVQVMPRIAIRGRVAFLPYEPEFDVDDIRFSFELPSPQAGLFADLTVAGPLRLTGGLRYVAKDLSATAVITGTVDIGDSTYSGADLGVFTGAIETSKLSPYLGIGLGSVAGSGFGVFFDAGVAFHGTPRITFTATGPVASQATFQQELAQEQTSANDDISSFKYYPVIALGIRWGF